VDPLNTLLQSRDGFYVKRFHTVNLNIPETVGHHTCNVIAILFYLYDNKPPLEVIHIALHHDVPELILGDIPATAKWGHPRLQEAFSEAEKLVAENMGLANYQLKEADAWIIKYADVMDLCFKSIEELATGNAPFANILTNGLKFCASLVEGPLRDHERSKELFDILFTHPFVRVEKTKSSSSAATLQ
jgi:5'-deoxynucleotidase YfbR-like HD superfamily hydrolase